MLDAPDVAAVAFEDQRKGPDSDGWMERIVVQEEWKMKVQGAITSRSRELAWAEYRFFQKVENGIDEGQCKLHFLSLLCIMCFGYVIGFCCSLYLTVFLLLYATQFLYFSA